MRNKKEIVINGGNKEKVLIKRSNFTLEKDF
jgi:hypothetical protein